MAAPTSALTFQGLILAVAKFLGVAYYGVAGNEAAQIPVDAHNLDLCKSVVNDGIRKFFNDAPITGWMFSRPVMDFTIFGDYGVKATRTVSAGSYDSANDETTLTSTEDIFAEGMEYLNIVTTTTGTFQMKTFGTATSMIVIGDASSVSAETFTIDASGSFTLPGSFGGTYTGDVTYAEETNQGVSLRWVNEATIRQWREDISDETGDPYWVAIRPHTNAVARAARRYELLTYPEPDEVMVIQFPYQLHFDSLVALTEVPPTPFHHDETIRQSCLAIAERDVEDVSSSHHQQEYDRCIQRSHQIDARSGPRRLGYFSNPASPTGNVIETFRNQWYDRPDVSFNTS